MIKRLQRLLPESLTMRLILSVSLLLIAGIAVGVIYTVGNIEEASEAAARQRISAIATTLAPHIDARTHEEMAAAYPDRDDIADWSDAPPRLRDLHRTLREAQKSNELPSPVYTLRIREGFKERILAEPNRAHADAMEFIVTSSRTPYWRHTYDYRPAMATTLLEGKPRTTGAYEDEHGSWLSAYAPLRDDEGRIVGLVEVDTPFDVFWTSVRSVVTRQVATKAGLLGCMLLIILLVTTRLTASLKHLCRAAERLGEGGLLLADRGHRRQRGPPPGRSPRYGAH